MRDHLILIWRLQQITGMMYEDYVQKYILDPLGMNNTGFLFTEEVKRNMATGYNPDGSEAPLVDLGWIAPAGQMYSTVADLNTLTRLLMHPDERNNVFMYPSSIREMALPAYLNPSGLSLFSTPWEAFFMEPYLVRTKIGNIYGFTALTSFIPDLKLSINILWNSQSDPDVFVMELYPLILPVFYSVLMENQVLPPLPPNPTMYVGTYAGESIWFVNSTITIMLEEDKLIFQGEGTKLLMEWISEEIDTFRLRWLPDNQLSCLSQEFSAVNGDWITFNIDATAIFAAGLGFPILSKQTNAEI